MDAWVFQAPLTFSPVNGVVPYIFHQQPFQPSQFNADIVTEELKSRFEVVQTNEGLVIGVAKGDLEDGRRPERVIHAEMTYERTLPFIDSVDPRPGGSRHLEMEFTHGLMGTDPFFDLLKEPVVEHQFVDPEGNPLETVEIGVNSNFRDTQRQIKIVTSFPTRWNRPEEEQYKTHHVEYLFQDGKLEVAKFYPYLRNSVLMSDTYATDIFNTLHTLIPRAPTATPQPEGRATPELPTPKALPPARRRRPPGR